MRRHPARDRIPCPEHQLSIKHCDGCGSLKIAHGSGYYWGDDWKRVRLDLCEGCYARAEMARDWLLGGVIADESNPAFEYIRRLESALCALVFETARHPHAERRRAEVESALLKAKHALSDAQRLITEDVDEGHPARYRVLADIRRAGDACGQAFYEGPPPYAPTEGLG